MSQSIEDLYSAFDMNEDAEVKGIPVNYGKFVVTIARAGGSNDHYRKVLEQECKPVSTAMELGELPENEARQLFYRTFARSIVKRWQIRTDDGLVDGLGYDAAGAIIEFNEKNLIALWTKRHELFLRIRKDADTMELYQSRAREAVAKN